MGQLLPMLLLGWWLAEGSGLINSLWLQFYQRQMGELENGC
jgi:hypothetical protein